MKIVIAEDERETRQLLTMYLEGKGHEVTALGDGGRALEAIREKAADLLLLDVRMPVLDGWSVLAAVRSLKPELPILMITALDSAEDAVKGLSLGADDYIRKPFDLAELDARLNSILRRIEKKSFASLLKVGALKINDQTKTVQVGNSEIILSPKEYGLLQVLASKPGQVFSSQDIIQYVWGKNSPANEGDVKQYVYLLRKKLKPYRDEGVKLITVTGFGYKLENVLENESS